MKRFVLAALPLLALPAVAQETITVQQLKQDVAQAKVIGVMGAVMGPTVKNAPYAATEVRENAQTLTDGTHIDNKFSTMVYRDGEGRVRRETPDQVTIFDPVANATYLLDPRTQTARKMPLALGKPGPTPAGERAVRFFYQTQGPVSAGGSFTTATAAGATFSVNPNAGVPVPPPPPPPGAGTIAIARGIGEGGAPFNVMFADGKQVNLPEPQTQSLGTENVNGVSAQGTRITSTIPAGAIGNDRPIQSVSETWYSPDLQITVKNVHTDPRMGTDTLEVTNILRAEPSPELFQVPAGYQVVEPK